MILNMLSTGAMIRLGKTYGNLMVDLAATNLKPKDRGERMLMEVCAVSREDARVVLATAGGSVKTAIVMQSCGLPRQEAERRIEQAGGVIRRVLRP